MLVDRENFLVQNLTRKWALKLILSLFLPTLVHSVCYEPFGCFDLDSDFFNPITRPIVWSPQKPETIGTRFFIYSKWIQSEEQCPGHLTNETTSDEEPSTWLQCVINTDDLLNQTVLSQTLRAISSGRKAEERQHGTTWTAFVIHGWIASLKNNPFLFEIKNRLLKTRALPYDTVVVVDWNQGALTLYEKACANARLVGAETAYFIRQLIANVDGIDLERIHLIGHSLGAHLAGYAGAEFTKGQKQLERITGLDPAGPFFDKQSDRVRLDRSDARFVDTIHTSGLYLSQPGLGTKNPTGHIDFFPNGGGDQPGCYNSILFPIRKLICNHYRATDFFVASIPVPNQSNNSCSFDSAQCSSWEDFQSNKCQAKEQCLNGSSESQENLCQTYRQQQLNSKIESSLELEAVCAQMGLLAYQIADPKTGPALKQSNSSLVMYLQTSSKPPFCWP